LGWTLAQEWVFTNLCISVTKNAAFQGSMSFVGLRRRTTEVLQKKMYKNDIANWLAKADEQDGPTPNSR